MLNFVWDPRPAPPGVADAGGSRAVAILAASGFDTSGLRNHAVPLLEKDMDLLLQVAESRDAAAPVNLASLARRALTVLRENEDPFEA